MTLPLQVMYTHQKTKKHKVWQVWTDSNYYMYIHVYNYYCQFFAYLERFRTPWAFIIYVRIHWNVAEELKHPVIIFRIDFSFHYKSIKEKVVYNQVWFQVWSLFHVWSYVKLTIGMCIVLILLFIKKRCTHSLGVWEVNEAAKYNSGWSYLK